MTIHDRPAEFNSEIRRTCPGLFIFICIKRAPNAKDPERNLDGRDYDKKRRTARARGVNFAGKTHL